MMRTPFLFGAWLALLGGIELAAQAIPTAPAYLPGQQYSLQLRTSTEDVRDHPPRKTYQAPIALRVLRKSTDGTFLDWVTGKSAAAAGAPADPVLELAESIFENLHLMVHLDAAGKYQGIENEDELKAKIQEFELLLIPQATAKIADPAQRARMAAAIAKAMTPAAMLSAAREEVDLYFGLSGLPLEAGKPLRIQSSILNPFGQPGTLDGPMEITPADFDSAKGQARIEFRQQFDPAGAASKKDLVFGSPSATPDGGLSLTDSGEYVMDLASGQVKQVRHTRTIRQNGQVVRTETTAITLQ